MFAVGYFPVGYFGAGYFPPGVSGIIPVTSGSKSGVYRGKSVGTSGVTKKHRTTGHKYVSEPTKEE